MTLPSLACCADCVLGNTLLSFDYNRTVGPRAEPQVRVAPEQTIDTHKIILSKFTTWHSSGNRGECIAPELQAWSPGSKDWNLYDRHQQFRLTWERTRSSPQSTSQLGAMQEREVDTPRDICVSQCISQHWEQKLCWQPLGEVNCVSGRWSAHTEQ